jgi:hypothetical protein
MSQELLLLWDRDSSETQEGERPQLEVGTRILVKRQPTKRTECLCNDLMIVPYVPNCNQEF